MQENHFEDMFDDIFIFLTHLNYFSVNKVPARVGIKKVILEEVEGREVSRFF